MGAGPLCKDPADRLIVALDVPSLVQALELVSRFEGQCRWFKVGLELFLAEGPSVVAALRERDFRVFLDLKLHDIPNTVASAVRSVLKLQPSLLTIHALGGPVMMEAAQDAASGSPDLKLLAVTVLTSMDMEQLRRVGVPDEPAGQVLRLGAAAVAAGLPGLVCSPQEALPLRSLLGESPLLVVPGIRPVQADLEVIGDDQRRTASPTEAILQGASMIVVGRPLTRAKNPAQAARAVLDQIASAG